MAHHSCVGEIAPFSALILVLSFIFLSKYTGGILRWITACWAVSQSLNLAAVKDGHLHRSEKIGVEFLLSPIYLSQAAWEDALCVGQAGSAQHS